ncbi:MAG: 30S ribosomal protein S8 [Pseudomonadota bacterium]
MSMTDPIADMLTRIRNAQRANKATVTMPASKQKEAIARVLESEGYIAGFESDAAGALSSLTIDLKYFEGQPVIEKIERISKPGRRVYRPNGDLPRVIGGLGIAVVSTSNGVMSDREARKHGIGGEVLCIVS